MGLDHLASLRSDVERFAAAVEAGPADAPVAGCPGWTLTDLGVHLGDVHRWVLRAIAGGAAPQGPHDDPAPSGDPVALGQWIRAGGQRLADVLDATDPDAPTWHPFPVEPKLAGLWRRRQAQEASVHRWDAERAVAMSAGGAEPTIAASSAIDGVDEYFTVMLPRMLTRESRRTPSTIISVEVTETGQRWVIDGSSGLPALTAQDAPIAASFSADAATTLLRWWGRPVSHPFDIEGDAAVMEEWLSLGGA